MTLLALRLSLALWKRRLDYRRKKLVAYQQEIVVNQKLKNAKKVAAGQRGVAKWQPLVTQAVNMCHQREQEIIAKRPKPQPNIRLEGLDYTSMAPSEAKAKGARFVCRYLSHDSSKNLSPSESKDLARLGIKRVVVWETTANRALDGRDAGRSDAHEAQRQAYACGMPSSRPIYFAIDFDTAGNPGAVDAYFDGVKDILGQSRTGAYGGIEAIKHLFDDHRISFGWQTYAWSGSQWDPRAQIQQYDNSNNAFDKDRSTRTDFGQW